MASSGLGAADRYDAEFAADTAPAIVLQRTHKHSVAQDKARFFELVIKPPWIDGERPICRTWIPACAGMTRLGLRRHSFIQSSIGHLVARAIAVRRASPSNARQRAQTCWSGRSK